MQKKKLHFQIESNMSVPVLDLVGSGHVVNVHPYLICDMWREFRRGGVGKHKDHTCPKLPILQQLQSPLNQLTLSTQPLQLVQRETLVANTQKNLICNSYYNLLLLDRRVWGREVPLWLVRELWWCGWCHCRCPARLFELWGSLECPARAWTGSVQYGRRSRTCSLGASWPAPPLPAASTDPVIHMQTWVFFLLPNDKHNALIDGSGWVLTRSSWISTLLSM